MKNTRIFDRRKSQYSNSGSQCQLSPLLSIDILCCNYTCTCTCMHMYKSPRSQIFGHPCFTTYMYMYMSCTWLYTHHGIGAIPGHRVFFRCVCQLTVFKPANTLNNTTTWVVLLTDIHVHYVAALSFNIHVHVHVQWNLSKTTAQGTFKTRSLLPGGLLIQGHLTGNSIP